MAERRYRDRDWNVANDGGVIRDSIKGGVMLAVMLDIRDELRKLNALLSCGNFTGIPRTLKQIATNTTKPKGIVK